MWGYLGHRCGHSRYPRRRPQPGRSGRHESGRPEDRRRRPGETGRVSCLTPYNILEWERFHLVQIRLTLLIIPKTHSGSLRYFDLRWSTSHQNNLVQIRGQKRNFPKFSPSLLPGTRRGRAPLRRRGRWRRAGRSDRGGSGGGGAGSAADRSVAGGRA